MSRSDQKVSVIEDSVKELALHGSADRVEMLFVQTGRTMKRLGISVGHKIQPFGKVPNHKGNLPGLHDMMLWLDNLQNTDQFADDIVFFKQLHLTLRNRVSDELIAEVEG